MDSRIHLPGLVMNHFEVRRSQLNLHGCEWSILGFCVLGRSKGGLRNGRFLDVSIWKATFEWPNYTGPPPKKAQKLENKTQKIIRHEQFLEGFALGEGDTLGFPLNFQCSVHVSEKRGILLVHILPLLRCLCCYQMISCWKARVASVASEQHVSPGRPAVNTPQ